MASRLRNLGFLGVLLIAVAEASPIAAQGAFDKVPKRPTLRAGEDSNSATDYYAYGVSALATEPYKAASAFYWASRLDPTWAAPLYGQYAALLLDEPESILTAYLLRRDVAVRDSALQRVVDLAYLAALKNPFVDRRFFGVVQSTWVARESNGAAELRDFGMGNRAFAAWAAYTRGDFKMAAEVYLEAIKQYPHDPQLQLERSWSLFALGQHDSARAAVQAALVLERNEEIPAIGWASHAFGEYSVGFLFDLDQQRDSARAAYERALLDDVSFFPAHHRLARLRLAAHDTAGALAEYGQAASLAPKEAGYLYDLGMLLVAAGRADSGVTVLQQATTVEPFFALPHYPLAVLYQQGGFPREAADHYAAFLRVAPRSMAPAINAARERLALLTAPAGP